MLVHDLWSYKHGWVVRISLEVTDLCAVCGVVKFLEAVFTEEGGALGRHLVLQSYPNGRKNIAHETLPALAQVHRGCSGVVR